MTKVPAKNLTPQLARAAAQDAANRQMRKAGRTMWNEDDFNLACEILAKLTATND